LTPHENMNQDRFYRAALAWAKRRGFEGDELPPGVPGSACRCPLAVATGLGVDYSGNTVESGSADVDSEHWPPSHYAPLVAYFMFRFDAGDYPELLSQ
jgi:hypothetical protein